jgi:hypothetical protein
LPSPSPSPSASASPPPGPPPPLRMLSTDYHIGPIADVKHYLSTTFPGNITVTDLSLSGACGLTSTCARADELAVLRAGDTAGIYASRELKRALFDAYANAPSLPLSHDVFHCSHPTGMCELFMPFNISMLVLATTRFEQGRENDAARFAAFVRNFRAMAAMPGTTVLANNLYDAHYVYYYTGVRPRHVPSLCTYTGASYSWRPSNAAAPRAIPVVGFRPLKGGLHPGAVDDFMQPLSVLVRKRGLPYTFGGFRALLGEHYSYPQLASFPALLYLPYQVSTMSFYEQYSMGIPIIAPSARLLAQWQMEYSLVSELTWSLAFRTGGTRKGVLPRHPSVAAADEPFDPNDEDSVDAVRHWLQHADFYTFPHVILFDSWEELATKLASVDFPAVSTRMLQHVEVLKRELSEVWGGMLQRVASTRASVRPRLEGSYNERMDAIYGSGQWADY